MSRVINTKTYSKTPILFGLLVAAGLATPALAATLSLTPATATLPIGASRQLTAYLDGVATSQVTWSVNGTPGGNAVVGFVSPSGNYTAPYGPVGSTLSITANSTTVSASATAALTLRNQIPWTTGLNPKTVSLGAVTFQVIGSRFVDGATVLWNGTPVTTTFQSPTLLTATTTATQGGTVAITVSNPGPGAVSSPALTLMVLATTPTFTRTRTPTPTPTRTRTQRPTPTPTATPTIAITVLPSTLTLQVGTSQLFQASVSNTANQAVTWSVNGVLGGNANSGTITPAGLYVAPAALPFTASALISATSVADPSKKATATVTLTDPFALSYLRLLDQATFGPTQALQAHVAQVGMVGFVDEQLGLSESTWPDVQTAQRHDVIEAFFTNALTGQDQLRQRVLYALSEILVESFNKNTNGEDMLPWLQLLSRNAFGNYRTLLRELTLDASMGKFLDLANSGIAGGAANENYPREVMQLFSIGLYQLNGDGSVKVDAQNTPLPSYTQTDVQQLAKALTGWTYGNATGTPPSNGRFSYYPGPMLPVAAYHNTSAKTILGKTLPANQSIDKDLDDAIDAIFEHPNVGPFLATRLIRALVTSNPSPQYIGRVAAVFDDNGATPAVRGDMKAVIRAILLDPEARNDNPASNFGRLRTPMQHTIAVARRLGITLGSPASFAYLFYDMHEGLLDAPSVFGHYSPGYRIPKTFLFGPEFQIYSASDAVNRANWLYSRMFNPWPINPALQPFVALAGNPTLLVNAVDQALLYGRMSTSTRDAIVNSMGAMPDLNARALSALYLTVTSGEALVQR